jgi:hypothetical protein
LHPKHTHGRTDAHTRTHTHTNIYFTVLCSAYGTIVGSCAMSFLPTGGLFVTGGLTTNHIHRMANNEEESSSSSSLFMKAYSFKGRASFLLDDIPLYAVAAKNQGLRGAAVRANMVSVTTYVVLVVSIYKVQHNLLCYSSISHTLLVYFLIHVHRTLSNICNNKKKEYEKRHKK